MSRRTLYTCDSCSKEAGSIPEQGPLILSIQFGQHSTPVVRRFGNSSTDFCADCVARIQDKYQELINSLNTKETTNA